MWDYELSWDYPKLALVHFGKNSEPKVISASFSWFQPRKNRQLLGTPTSSWATASRTNQATWGMHGADLNIAMQGFFGDNSWMLADWGKRWLFSYSYIFWPCSTCGMHSPKIEEWPNSKSSGFRAHNDLMIWTWTLQHQHFTLWQWPLCCRNKTLEALTITSQIHVEILKPKRIFRFLWFLFHDSELSPDSAPDTSGILSLGLGQISRRKPHVCWDSLVVPGHLRSGQALVPATTNGFPPRNSPPFRWDSHQGSNNKNVAK